MECCRCTEIQKILRRVPFTTPGTRASPNGNAGYGNPWRAETGEASRCLRRPEPTPERASSMPPEMPAVKICIVDDDKAICDYMQTLLERDGYGVKTMSDPTTIDDEVKNGGYHLI